MNDRIRGIERQSGIELYGLGKDRSKWQQSLEKFSELLIKETMQVVADNLPSNTYLDVADAVIEHFRVEEVEDCLRCGSPWSGTSCGIPDCGWVTGVEE